MNPKHQGDSAALALSSAWAETGTDEVAYEDQRNWFEIEQQKFEKRLDEHEKRYALAASKGETFPLAQPGAADKLVSDVMAHKFAGQAPKP